MLWSMPYCICCQCILIFRMKYIALYSAIKTIRFCKGQTRTEKPIWNTMMWPGLTQDVDCCVPLVQSFNWQRKSVRNITYCLLGLDLRGSCGSFHQKGTTQDTYSAGTHYDRSGPRMVWDCQSQWYISRIYPGFVSYHLFGMISASSSYCLWQWRQMQA
jgi:hypothetical protein